MLAQAMLVVTFVLGVLLLLGGSGAFIFFTIRGLGSDGGLRIKVADWFEIDTTQASLGLLSVGLVLMLTGVFGVMALQAKSRALESALDVAKDQIKGNVAFVKVPFGRLSESEDRGTAEERNVEEYEAAQSEVLERMDQILVNEVLAETLVNSFQSDTFGLVEIPDQRIGEVEELVGRAAARFPQNTGLALDAANFYRSLYHRTEDSQYLGKWGDLVLPVLDDESALEGGTRTDSYVLAALYFQAKKDYDRALQVIYEAEKAAPEEKRHKVVFNICNILYEAERFDAAEERCKESSQLAEGQGVEFWQPVFTLGLIYREKERTEEAIGAFLDAHRSAQALGEGELMENYLAGQPEALDVPGLCRDEEFGREFRRLCDTGVTRTNEPEPPEADALAVIGPL